MQATRDISMGYEFEHKDRGIIHFHHAGGDTFNPDADPGFVERKEKPRFSDGSVIEQDDHAMQQSIYDRLPIPLSKRAEFFNWLVNDYQNESNQEQLKASHRDKKRKTRD
jgi:hypothetical protein